MSTANPLPNAADKAALKTLATEVVQACPSLQDSAHETACSILKKHGVTDLDPDDVYYHRFKSAQSSTKTFTGWEHVLEKPYESTTLTQLVIRRFRATDFDNADLLDLYGGFYTQGPVYGDFNETNEVRLHGNEVLNDFWEIKFDRLYTHQLDDFWHAHADDFRTLAKCNFLSKAVQAVDLKQLTREDLQTCINAVASNVTWPITRQMLQTEVTPAQSPQVYAMDVDGHVAFNLLRIVDPNGRQILYTPGDTPAFQVLETPADMHWWVLGKMNNEQSRSAFLCHFPLSDRQAMQDNITELMNRLVGTWGKSDHHLINRKNQAITSDAFTWLRDRTRWSMYDEAQQLLTTQAELQKKLWIGYLSAGLKVFGPMAAIGWVTALPVLGASIALTGLNIDQAANGRTRAERKAGVTAAVLNGIAMLFNVVALTGPGPITEVGAEVDAAEAAEMAEYKEALQPDPVDEPAVTTPNEEAPALPTATPLDPEPSIPASWARQQGLTGATPMTEGGRYSNIYTVNANPSTVITFKDAVYYVRYEADVNGDGSWAIIDPQNPHAFYGSRPVQLNAAGEWELALRPSDAVRGGAPVDTIAASEANLGAAVPEEAMPSTYGPPNCNNPPSSLSSPYDLNNLGQYQIELAMGGRPDHFKRIPKPGGGLTDFFTSDYFINPMRSKILTAARKFFSRPFFIHTLPERPALPSLTPEMSSSELLEEIIKNAPGLVVAESPSRVASLYILIKDMPTLARQGLKTLYLNRLLNDLHQLDLDTFANTGELSDGLRTYLEEMDALLPVRFNTQALLTTARAYGIRVQATGCLANYRSFPVAVDEQMVKNFLTSEIIRLDQLKNGVGKWVALTEAQNTNTYRGVAGISEINGGTSLRIGEDLNAASTRVNIRLGPKVINDAGATNPPLSSLDTDLSLDVPMTELDLPKPYVFTERQIENALKLPGDYLLEQTQTTLTLIHRNRLSALVRSTIQSTASNGYFIDAVQFPRLKGTVYSSLTELLQALNNQGMRLTGLPLIKLRVPAAELDGTALPAATKLPASGAGIVATGNPETIIPPTSVPEIPASWEANEILEGQTPDIAPGRYQGIYRLKSDPADAIMHDGKPYYVRYETYRDGTSGWAIINPHAPNDAADSIAVRLNAQGQWETLTR